MNQEVAFKTVVSGLMEENVAPSMMERALDSVKSAGTKKLRMIDAIFREKVHADLDFSGDHDTIESEDDGEEEEEEEDREMGENWKKQGGIEQVAPKSIMAKDTASLPRPSRSVQFSLNNDLYCSEQLKSLSHAELQARVRNLQVQMTDAIISLSSERAARRKNEKNLLKLAKELQKRANEISSKNDQVIKFAEAVNQAEIRARAAADVHKMEMSALRRGHEIEIEQIRAENEETIDSLQQKLVQANMTIQGLKRELRTLQSSVQDTNNDSSAKDIPSKKKIPFVPRLIAAALVGMLLYCFPLMDATCAPATPLTTVESDATVLEAPWWVVSPLKQPIFSCLCAPRTRSRLVWTADGTLTALALNSEVETILWSFPATAARIGWSKIYLKNERGRTTNAIDAPWSRQQIAH